MRSIIPLTIYHTYTKLPCPEQKLIEIAKEIFRKEKISSKKAVTLVLCSDYRIKKLNADYRNKDKATDVLSFRFDEPDFLGEIYISLQRAKIQASKYGLHYDEEITRLFVHGMFHLLGYDHETEAQRKIMEARERNYFDTESQ